MRIAFWGKGARGASCLEKVIEAGFQVVVAVAQAGLERADALSVLADRLDLPVMTTEDPNSESFRKQLAAYAPDISLLAGCGQILSPQTIALPTMMSINLHAGKLPEYRGSSPMNWALMRGDSSFTISVIRVDAGVDTGDILLERTFSIAPRDTIRELHDIANRHFPEMVVEVLHQIALGTLKPKPQQKDAGSYCPLRFPDDGLIIWDLLTAEQVYNRIRALTDPYPCAFSYYRGRKVLLTAARPAEPPYYGSPGRIYKLSGKNGMLVCASDRCLWITEARFADTGEDLLDNICRYDELWSLGQMMRTVAGSSALTKQDSR